MDNTADVDFDFFETPREIIETPKSLVKSLQTKPPSPHKHDTGRYDTHERFGSDFGAKNPDKPSTSKESNKNDNYSDDFSSSETDSETPRNERAPARMKNGSNGKKFVQKSAKENRKSSDMSLSESSSAYSNSDYSSDDSYEERRTKERESRKPVEKIEIKIPQAHLQAWGDGEKFNNKELKDSENSGKKYTMDRDVRKPSKTHTEYINYQKDRSSSESSESDDSPERYERKNEASNKHGKIDRVKSAKTRERKNSRERRPRRQLRSTSSSHSNNSDITDVSPLDSPENSPRAERKKYSSNGKHNGQFDDVQYRDSDTLDRDVDIQLDSDKIDLNILMKCMADIDKEKRLKTNSRRVMFAPHTSQDKSKPNYTYSVGRAKTIEKENQRLLKQIMNHVNPGSTKLKETRTTVTRKKPAEPAIHRLTPSAVNRQKEQRRIENENMHILSRLHQVKPTSGMSRTEQMKEFEKVASYGVPTGTVIIPGNTGHYNTSQRHDLHSSMSHTSGSTQRSRPSSAKSNASVPGKRSRPSSAKSNASIRSNASMRSNASIRSNVSIRSGVRTREEVDNRPSWDDRFSFQS